MTSKQVTLYTDGACKGNPGPGGWGAVLEYGEHRKELFGGEARIIVMGSQARVMSQSTTNMEMLCL